MHKDKILSHSDRSTLWRERPRPRFGRRHLRRIATLTEGPASALQRSLMEGYQGQIPRLVHQVRDWFSGVAIKMGRRRPEERNITCQIASVLSL
jgi:hypothetical protein